MEEDNLQFTVYVERAEIVNLLTNEEAGQVFKSLFDYLAGYEPNLTSKTAKLAFTIFVQDIEMR